MRGAKIGGCFRGMGAVLLSGVPGVGPVGVFSMPWEKMAVFLTVPCGWSPAALNGLFDERRQQMELTRKRYKRGVQPC